MFDSKFNTHGLASLLGSALAMCSTLTLSDVSVMVGIFTALLTLFMNLVYTYRKDRREQRESEARLKKDQ